MTKSVCRRDQETTDSCALVSRTHSFQMWYSHIRWRCRCDKKLNEASNTKYFLGTVPGFDEERSWITP